MSDDLSKVGAALKRSMTALDDWLATYADDMCDPAHVEAARARIAEFGTLAYIADVQQQNREALAGIPSDPIAKRMEALVREAVDSPDRLLADKARAIVALLPEPVDPDLVEARRIVAGRGINPDDPEYYAALGIADEAIRQGLALERDSREG